MKIFSSIPPRSIQCLNCGFCFCFVSYQTFFYSIKFEAKKNSGQTLFQVWFMVFSFFLIMNPSEIHTYSLLGFFKKMKNIFSGKNFSIVHVYLSVMCVFVSIKLKDFSSIQFNFFGQKKIHENSFKASIQGKKNFFG